MAAVISVLARYSVAIIREVTEPATGLPAQLKWLPTIAEIRNECEVLDAREQRKVEREKQIQEQFAARRQITDQRERPSYEELVRRCHADGLLIGPKVSPMSPPLDPAFVREKHGISQEQWDKIPNAKIATE